MDHEQTELSDLAADMRLAFDQTFAVMPGDTSEDTERFLAVELGGDYYVLRLMEISGLFADKQVVPLPSHAPDLLGIASFRGVLVPVYDLRALLGYPAGPLPRWLAVVAAEPSVALAFDHFDGYVDLPSDAVAQEVAPDKLRQHVARTIRHDNLVRSIIDTTSIVKAISQRG